MPQVLRISPPSALLQPVPAPEWRGRANADLLDYAQDLESALAAANARLTAVERFHSPEGARPEAEARPVSLPLQGR